MTDEVQAMFDELQRKGYFKPDRNGEVIEAIRIAADGIRRINKRERHFGYLEGKKEQKTKDAGTEERAYNKGVTTTFKHLLKDLNSFMQTTPEELHRKLRPMRDRWHNAAVELIRKTDR